MQEFDPRRPAAIRLGPPLLAAIGGLTAAVVGWQALHNDAPPSATAHIDPAAVTALQKQAQARLHPVTPASVSMIIKVAPGETLESAVRRTGVGKDEARAAVDMLAKAFDIAKIRAGMALEAHIAKPIGQENPAKLVGLSMQIGPATAVSLSRALDGALQLNKLEEKVVDKTVVATGHMEGSLYVSAQKAGVSPELTSQVAKLFQHKLDFSRDIQPGDRFSMVIDRKVTASGRAVSTGDLLFAEIEAKGGTTKLYRFTPPGSKDAEYFDEAGKNIRSMLLRTPLDIVRITSSFGMREHPILGYTRMHMGIDFGAPQGTPVYAAGDGVVEKAAWTNGYGRWLQIKHQNGMETGYGHLSRWAVKQGQHVHQGQVVAYVGSTGLSTGPHLHYEIMVGGKKVNPSKFKAPPSVALAGKELAAFKAEKTRIDAMVSPPKVAANGAVPPGA
ncbi:MAG TPA: peptidoglycan DD-metalloendopeptidase family protein [Caulobacteraceae bacterium]|jgi:murein DD-endopeptidase MepM/ murein hydrolase activator NlpD